ncbi:hypothetical protein ACHQM5_025297 [Ranunculus cassubicifolius]
MEERRSFLYCAAPPPPPSVTVAPNNNNNNPNSSSNLLDMNTFHLIQPNHSFLSSSQVKNEATSSSQHPNREFCYSLLSTNPENHHQQQQQQTVNHFLFQHHGQDDNGVDSSIKAKIMSHPQYSNLLEAYMDCQKVGAPEEVVNRLTSVRREFETHRKANMNCTNVQRDPELDQFMEAYCDMLVKYREELTRPLQEAMEFMKRIEAQLKTISNDPIRIFTDEKCDRVGSSEDEQEDNRGETEVPEIDPRAEDKELKTHLLKKYSGYLSSLKQELSKKKKKGKLPKEARQKLLNWWEIHYKWPYPSETEKVALAESTGLDQKQINNWFINQRKRHWKPSEDMQSMVMDGIHPHSMALYMDGHYIVDGNYRLGP